MPAKQNRKQQLAAWRAGQEEQAAVQRYFCTRLLFWKYCGHKKCLRAQVCAGDVKECFSRFWPAVPEQVKIGIRAAAKANQAGLSKPEIVAAIKRELKRGCETMTPRQVPPTQSVERAAPRAASPRLRVL